MPKILLIVCFLCIFPVGLYPQLYIGIGPTGILPQNKLIDVNKESVGLNIVLETRTYCNLWYGMRFDYLPLEKEETLGDTISYFKNAIFISPQVRWNFLFENCYEEKVIPYLQGMFTISSIGKSDNSGRFGLGAAGGGGVTLGFNLLDRCWLLDLCALWSAPNSILRADDRESVQALLLSLTISVGL